MSGGFMSCCISTRSKLNQSTKYRQEKYSTSDIRHHWSHQQHKSHHLVLHQLEQSAEEQCDKVSQAKEFIILCGYLCQKQIFSQKGQHMKLKWNQELFFFTQFFMSKWLLFLKLFVLGIFMHFLLSDSVMYEKKSFHILEQMNGRNWYLFEHRLILYPLSMHRIKHLNIRETLGSISTTKCIDSPIDTNPSKAPLFTSQRWACGPIITASVITVNFIQKINAESGQRLKYESSRGN